MKLNNIVDTVKFDERTFTSDFIFIVLSYFAQLKRCNNAIADRNSLRMAVELINLLCDCLRLQRHAELLIQLDLILFCTEIFKLHDEAFFVN